MSLFRAWAAMLIPAALAGACTGHTHEPFDPQRAVWPGRENPAADAIYRRQATWQDHSNSRLSEQDTAGHEAHHIRFPSAGDNGQPGLQVEGMYYQARQEGAHPLLVVLPIWGSHRYPSEKITAGLLRRYGQIHVFRLLGENPLLDWEGLARIEDERQVAAYARAHAERMRVAVADVLQIVGWAESLPEVDSDRIGLVGFSISALIGSIALANEPRLAAGYWSWAEAGWNKSPCIVPGGRDWPGNTC